MMQNRMNMNDYQNYIKNAQSRRNLAELTVQYLAEVLNQNNFAVIQHSPAPQPFNLLSNYKLIDDFSIWQHNFSDIKPPQNSLEILSHKKNFYCFLNTDFGHGDSYFWCASKAPDAEVENILKHWQLLDQQLATILDTQEKELSVGNANIVSQLLHDIEAIIELSPKNLISEELEQRLKYQKKLNANLLFYIRPLELFKEPIPVNDLIKSSLDMIDFQTDSIKLNIPESLPEISVDAEMFAKGFNEIVLNAITACGNAAGSISINISRQQQISPLLNFSWLKIEVCDTGKSIVEDFLPYVQEPFFTTLKHEGHTGFGLNTAQKVFKEHGGSLDINVSEGIGTTVTIYLPMENE